MFGDNDTRADILPDAMPEGWRSQAALEQQVWGINACYEAVRNWGHTHGIEYELIIRQRSDHDLHVWNVSNFPPPLPPGYGNGKLVVPNEHHYTGINDRFGIGTIEAMRPHMATRYCTLVKQRVGHPLGEPWLVKLYKEAGISVMFEQELHSNTLNWQGGPELRTQCGMLSHDLPAQIRST